MEDSILTQRKPIWDVLDSFEYGYLTQIRYEYLVPITLTIQELDHGHYLDSITIGYTEPSLYERWPIWKILEAFEPRHLDVIRYAYLIKTASVGTISSIDDVVHGINLDSVVITTNKSELTVDEIEHSCVLDSIALIYGAKDEPKFGNRYNINAILSGWYKFYPVQFSRNFILPESGITLLNIGDVQHGCIVDNITVTQKNSIIVDSLEHAHELDKVKFEFLDVQNVLHGHTLDHVSLLQEQILQIDSIEHTHLIDNVILNAAWVSLDGIGFYAQ